MRSCFHQHIHSLFKGTSHESSSVLSVDTMSCNGHKMTLGSHHITQHGQVTIVHIQTIKGQDLNNEEVITEHYLKFMQLTVSISFSTLFLTASIPRQEKISQMSLLIVLTGSTSLSAKTYKIIDHKNKYEFKSLSPS